MPWARAANWVVGVSAVVLMAVSVGGYFYHRRQLGAIAAKHLRLVVTGPAELRAGVSARFHVVSATVTGEPVPARVEFGLYSPEFQQVEASDTAGQLEIEIPGNRILPRSAGSEAQLKVVATHEKKREEAALSLPVRTAGLITQLTVARPNYQPGETIYYRSLTLSRLGQPTDRPLPVCFEVLDPTGAVVPGSHVEGLTEGAIGNGAFDLPKQAADGRYTVVARSLDGAFPEEKAFFSIQARHARYFAQELDFAHGGYAPGDTVVANLRIRRAEGSAAGSPSLKIVATVDGQTVFQRFAQPDAAGRLRIEFTLPPKIERGQGQLVIEAGEAGHHETFTKAIPLKGSRPEAQVGKLDVRFYPEGGELAEGLESRVYFTARDAQGKPVPLKGMIVDSRGEDVARVEATYEGRGSLAIVPRSGETYSLKVTAPAGISERPKLPAAPREQRIVISTGTGVFQAGTPLEFSLRVSKPDIPLVVTAWCRGELVGQQMLVTTKKEKDASALHAVTIPLDEQIGGVIRLAVYDYSSNPPQAVAERLVYRHLAKRLVVKRVDPVEPYRPGEKTNLTLEVTNENGQPVPATLGVVVRDEAAGPNADFLLSTAIQRPEDMEKADFCLSDGKDATAALDLLLGTQEWLRLARKTPEQIKAAGHDPERVARLAALNGPIHPTAMFDNLGDLRAKYEEGLTEYRAKQTRLLNAMVVMSFFGGLGLALLVTMLGLLNVIAGARLWGPILSAVVCCFVAGAVLMDPSRLKSVDGTAVCFTPFHLESKPDQSRPTAAPGSQAKPFADRKYAYQAPEASKGDKAGKGGRPAMLYWNPRLTAGPGGRATVSFELPNSAGTYSVLVEAHHEGRIGSARMKISGGVAGKK
jgi:hypothetical protein